MNNREIYDGIMACAVCAPDVSTGRITMRFDAFKITCNNDWRSIGAVAARFKRPRFQHTNGYQAGQTAARGQQAKREPISRLVARYPEDREAFELLG